MKVDFDKNEGGGFPMCFYEKHVAIIGTTKTVSQLLDDASKAGSSRAFGGQAAAVNSVMGLTMRQKESLFAWLLQNKAAALGKVTKDTMTEISDIRTWAASSPRIGARPWWPEVAGH
jgi:hypothetical protein